MNFKLSNDQRAIIESIQRLCGDFGEFEWWYTDDYKDADELAGLDNDIDSFNTFDLHYNYHYGDSLRVFLSVYNLTDEDPPHVNLDTSFDPYTASPFGRIAKFGVQYTIGSN